MSGRKRWLAIALCMGLAAPLWGAEADKKEEKPAKSDAKAVVAVFAFDGPVVEAPMSEDMLFAPRGMQPLKDLVSRLKKARDDKNVKAVVLLLDEVMLDLSQIEELRQVLDSIKASGKQVYAHVDSMLSTESYALAAGASSISVTPTAILFINGFRAEHLYLRGLLEKIGVTPDFLTCGEYKSAAELYMRKEPSPAAARMTDWLLDSLFESYLKLVAKGRGVKPQQVRLWIDSGLFTPEQAKELGMIDRVEHRQDFQASLKAKYGDQVVLDRNYGKKKRGSEIDFSSPLGVFKFWGELLGGSTCKSSGKDAVAIVYVEGPILPGKADASPFGGDRIAYSTPIRKALDKAAEDKAVKAVVLRVNSPGGSAVASEIILNATKRVKAAKPFVVSMGDVAGSGGYYVSCGSDTIFADATTITASIGVLGGKFATTEMWNKIGISWSSTSRGASAGILSSDGVFTASERQKFQGWMNDIYGVFKGHVVAARKDRLKKPIDELAGGRVFTGQQALEVGLVDKIGTLDDAVQFVAQKAKLSDYEVRVMPEPKGFLEILLEDISDREPENHRLSMATPASRGSILDLALPYLSGIDGARLRAVTSALKRLDLLAHEQVLLAMPEIIVGGR